MREAIADASNAVALRSAGSGRGLSSCVTGAPTSARTCRRSVAAPIATGLVIGLALGVGTGRAAAAMLFGVAPAQPVVVVLVATIVLAVALAACIEPAARAARTPVASTLRQ